MKRYLIDTHVWLWMQSDPDRLCDETRAIVQDVRTNILFSAASAWEIAIKYRLGKLPLPEPPASYVPDRMRRSGTSPCPSTTRTRSGPPIFPITIGIRSTVSSSLRRSCST